jgi:hypothetical protein
MERLEAATQQWLAISGVVMRKQAMSLYNHYAESGGKKKDSSQQNVPIKWLV